jgi:hypothetical protein
MVFLIGALVGAKWGWLNSRLQNAPQDDFQIKYQLSEGEQAFKIENLEKQWISQQKKMEMTLVEYIERLYEDEAYWLIESLRLSQIQWVKFIEANCEYESSTWSGTKYQVPVWYQCMARENEARAMFIK